MVTFRAFEPRRSADLRGLTGAGPVRCAPVERIAINPGKAGEGRGLDTAGLGVKASSFEVTFNVRVVCRTGGLHRKSSLRNLPRHFFSPCNVRVVRTATRTTRRAMG